MKPKARLAVIAPAEEREIYSAHVASLGLIGEPFDSLRAFFESGVRQQIIGVIVDVRCFLGVESTARHRFTEIDASFPVLRMRRNGATGDVSGIFEGACVVGLEAIDRFVSERCGGEAARGVRVHPRLKVHAGVRVRGVHPLTGEPIRLVASTLNASKRGIFIITSEPAPNVGAEVVVIWDCGAKDFAVSNWKAVVRWVIPWESLMKHLPGLGVEFVDLNEEQQQSLDHLLDSV